MSSAPRAEDEDLHEVIGGAEGERKSLAAALADPGRYYVSQATGQVWDRRYWGQIHGLAVEEDRAEAA